MQCTLQIADNKQGFEMLQRENCELGTLLTDDKQIILCNIA